MLTKRLKLENIAKSWIALWNSPINLKSFEELHSENFIDLSSSGRPSDKNGFRQGIIKLLEAFPDLKTEIDSILVDELKSQIAARWHSVGKNKLKYLGIGPTNKITEITGIEIIEIENEKIIKRWGEWDITNHINQ
ncbi:MAG: ester cyclase [Ignavibacteriae bacterium]|nr:ester cyclase [Ignavibacteriota bacterium]